jgi:Skp family chaperone for outer membrane proteins
VIPYVLRTPALLAAAIVLALPAATLTAGTARAQQAPGWFVPNTQAPAANPPAQPTGRRRGGRSVAPPPVDAAPPVPPPVDAGAPAGDTPDAVTEAELQQKLANLPQPPVPPLPPIVSGLYAASATGDAVKISASGIGAALPAPLTADTTYFLIRGAANEMQLAASASDATAGTAITLTSAGAGELKITAPVAHSGQTNVAADFTVKLPGTLKLLAGGSVPPAGVIGVLGVPDVMRASSAAQAVDKVIGARKERLQLEAQRAEANWREMQQSLQNDAAHLTRDQALTRERALQDRVRTDRKQLQERQRVIQEAAQVALGQIERTLIQIIRQVAESRGMNLVLHRSQVALNVQDFDITEAVVAQLNKALPTVQIPADNVDPATLPKDWGTPGK